MSLVISILLPILAALVVVSIAMLVILWVIKTPTGKMAITAVFVMLCWFAASGILG